MAAVSALVFLGAVALIAFVFLNTLIPALPRIAAVLSGAEAEPQPRLVLARHRRALSRSSRSVRLAHRLREAA
ncbi:MAG: hypothetical protein ACTHMG_05320 [Sphingomonas sp.]